ncbi:hypothetical protein C8A05DRAFT_46483 [Staphylotrichum tortipilum]|uniref:Uncharacterized protein n=1 Tax=Staphylotrichum tortipilum TaxID=2831512 RepID=A0AAN6RQV5_9PEZI|nr:hypothetical protein C8A05DRAFT_46483 [Staphylotrichum longicolle]
MVPPTKRQRVGPAPAPAPFDNLDDDPEADELNERPEDVNARRDPAARLERSRAFAAFKLKSAFENIFEKYERDFTGIGDEIDLRTGEIVVNNGHIESLTTAQLTIGRGDGEDSGGDGASDAGSLNEEEQMLRGKVDVRLSRLGQHALPSSVSTPPHFGAPPFFAAGTPLGIPGMLQPGQMQFGGFPTQYRSPIPLPAADPTWSTPELPSPFLRHALTFGKATPVVRKARLSLSTAREHDGADEDDIFLGGSASSQGKENSGQVSVKKKVLLARPKPEVGSAKKKSQAASAGSKESPRLAKRPKGSLGRKRAAPGTPTAPNSKDELSFLTPLKPRSTVARTTPASHHVRLGLLVPGASAAPSSSSASAKLRRVVARAAGKATPTAASNSNSNTPATVGSQGNKKRKRKSGPGLGPGLGPSTPSNDRRFALAAEEELVQTPGGTMRRCGENGFRCAREFCFSCL